MKRRGRHAVAGGGLEEAHGGRESGTHRQRGSAGSQEGTGIGKSVRVGRDRPAGSGVAGGHFLQCLLSSSTDHPPCILVQCKPFLKAGRSGRQVASLPHG